jgi:hypothetical protein
LDIISGLPSGFKPIPWRPAKEEKVFRITQLLDPCPRDVVKTERLL